MTPARPPSLTFRPVLLAALVLAACAGPQTPPTPTTGPRRSPTPAATATATPGGTPGPDATPTPAGTATPAASPSPLFGLPPAQETLAERAGGKLLAIAQIGFAQNRGKVAADGTGAFGMLAQPVGILSNNGGTLVSNNGAGLVSDLGGSLLSNNGAGVVSNNGGQYRLAQAAAAPSLVAEAGETLFADRRFTDGTRYMLFVKDVAATDDQFRKVYLRADGTASQQVRFETLAKWDGGQVKRATYRVTDYYADGTVRATQAYTYEPDAAGKTLRIAMLPGESQVREPATGVAVRFDKFEVDTTTKAGAFAYAYTHLDAVEAGTLTGVAPLANGQVPLTYDDPLGYYDGEATLTDKAGKVVYRKKQVHEGAAVKRTYDLQDGLTAELVRDADPLKYAGKLLDGGKPVADLMLTTRVDGSVFFKLVFPEAPDRPVELGFGLGAAASPAPSPGPTPAGIAVSTIAGAAAPGYADGAGATARFDTVSDVVRSVRDPNTFYVADSNNRRIRTLTLAGGAATVGTLAGTGATGAADGAAGGATFTAPVGLAIAPAANGGETLYVAEQLAPRIRAIDVTAAGAATVRTIAGTGVPGMADGPGATAQFRQPNNMAVDATANVLYVPDVEANRIRTVSLAGDHAVGTLFGSDAGGFADGPLAEAQTKAPYAVAIDAQRRLWIADRGNKRIRRVDLAAAQPAVTTVAGSGELLKSLTDGPALAGGLNPPMAIALDAAGNAFVAHFDVRVLTVAGELRTLAGGIRVGADDGPAPDAGFDYLFGLVSAGDGRLLVTDKHRVRAIAAPDGRKLVP